MKSLKLSKFKSKRAVTEMVGYVLLIVVTVSISILVYAYLSLQTPKDRPACPEGVSLQVQDQTCLYKPRRTIDNLQITLTITNNGRRSVDGAYIRFGSPNSKVKELINSNVYFGGESEFEEDLLPGKSITRSYKSSIEKTVGGEFGLEIEPLVGSVDKPALCTDAIITKKILCTLPTVPPGTVLPSEDLYTSIYPNPNYYKSDPSPNIRNDDSVVVKYKLNEQLVWSDAIDYMEINIHKRYTNEKVFSDKIYELDSNGDFVFSKVVGPEPIVQGNYDIRGVIVLYDGRKINLKQRYDKGGWNFEYLDPHFTVKQVSCIGTCVSDSNGAYVLIKSSGEKKCVIENICAGKYFFKRACKKECYTGDPEFDNPVFITSEGYKTSELPCGGHWTPLDVSNSPGYECK